MVKVCRKEHVARADALKVRWKILRTAAWGLRRDEGRVDSLCRIGRDDARSANKEEPNEENQMKKTK